MKNCNFFLIFLLVFSDMTASNLQKEELEQSSKGLCSFNGQHKSLASIPKEDECSEYKSEQQMSSSYEAMKNSDNSRKYRRSYNEKDNFNTNDARKTLMCKIPVKDCSGIDYEQITPPFVRTDSFEDYIVTMID